MLHTEVAFGRGSAGFLVADLQNALGISADRNFGPETEAAVRMTRRRAGLTEGTTATPELHHALGIKWPSVFERCLNLTSVLEGTGFGGFNSTDIDGAGLTFGCVGFTTRDGEVQEVLHRFFRLAPKELNRLTVPREPGSAVWREWAFDISGMVRPDVAEALHCWGAHPAMRIVQTLYARDRFWQPAERTCRRLGFRSVAALGFFFDVQVQNGGWRAQHQHKLMSNSHSATEPERLRSCAHIVAESSTPRWRPDVLSRKLLFGDLAGFVHGRRFNVRAFAIG